MNSLPEELVTESKTYYYRFKGEVNTRHVLEVAIKRAVELGLRKIIVASETGRSAVEALRLVKKHNLGLIVVTHPPDKTVGPKGDIPIGLRRPIYAKLLKCLEEGGATIIQGTRPFVSASRSFGWDKALPEAIIDSLLGGVFGQGIKIAIEASLMAADAGVVNKGDTVISLGGSYKGLDAAIVAKTTYTYYFLKEYELHEIIAKPWSPRVRLIGGRDPDWRGDIEKYYREPEC
jgi:hypothetical protein